MPPVLLLATAVTTLMSRSFDETAALMAAAKDALGSVDVLVNNAGNMGPVPPDIADAMKPSGGSTARA